MSFTRFTICCLLAGLVVSGAGSAPARAQDEPGDRTFPERQLEERNKERREESREWSKRDPGAPLYAPGGPARSTAPAPWNSTAPRSGGGKLPWNAK